jgi:hypothetical protein
MQDLFRVVSSPHYHLATLKASLHHRAESVVVLHSQDIFRRSERLDPDLGMNKSERLSLKSHSPLDSHKVRLKGRPSEFHQSI